MIYMDYFFVSGGRNLDPDGETILRSQNIDEAIAVLKQVCDAAVIHINRKSSGEVANGETRAVLADALDAVWYASDLLGGDADLEQWAADANTVLLRKGGN